jgi:hypothetical protein
MPSDSVELAAALAQSLRVARFCIDVAERELAVATAAGNEARLSAVPPKRLKDFDNATVAFEQALTRLLTHMAPQTARTLPAATELQRHAYDAKSGGRKSR